MVIQVGDVRVRVKILQSGSYPRWEGWIIGEKRRSRMLAAGKMNCTLLEAFAERIVTAWRFDPRPFDKHDRRINIP